MVGVMLMPELSFITIFSGKFTAKVLVLSATKIRLSVLNSDLLKVVASILIESFFYRKVIMFDCGKT